MRKILKLIVTSMLLLSGCSFSSNLSNRYDKLNSIPSFIMSNDNSMLDKIEFVVPNDGNGIKEREFFTSYSDLHDFSYVLDNIEKVEDEKVKKELKEVYEVFNNNPFHYKNDYSGRYAGYNIINIIGETLEIRFAHPELTPNLWHIMNNSMYFENYYVSEFQEGATCNTEFMSHAGLFPVVTSIWSGNMCQNENTTNDIFKYALPAQLQANGYNAYYFHLGYRGFYNRGNFIPNFGFNKDNIKFMQDLGYYNHVTDEHNIEFFKKYVDFSKPFYVSNLTYSMHGGYDEDSLGVTNESANRVLKALNKDLAYFSDMIQVFYYLQKLTYFDDYLGELLNLIKEKGVEDKTIINIYRDHSPYMMNNDHYTKYMKDYHPELDYRKDSIKRFNHPLLIYNCGNPKQEIIPYAGSSIDLVPTFLNLLGFDETNACYRHFMGQDILSGNALAFLSQQSTSNTNNLVIDENDVILEFGKLNDYNGEKEKYNYYYYYLYLYQHYINVIMKEIVDNNYFEYYYYYVEEEKNEEVESINKENNTIHS